MYGPKPKEKISTITYKSQKRDQFKEKEKKKMYDDQRAKRRDKKKLTSQKEKSDLYLPIKSPCLDETHQREISVTMREKLFREREEYQ